MLFYQVQLKTIQNFKVFMADSEWWEGKMCHDFASKKKLFNIFFYLFALASFWACSTVTSFDHFRTSFNLSDNSLLYGQTIKADFLTRQRLCLNEHYILLWEWIEKTQMANKTLMNYDGVGGGTFLYLFSFFLSFFGKLLFISELWLERRKFWLSCSFASSFSLELIPCAIFHNWFEKKLFE